MFIKRGIYLLIEKFLSFLSNKIICISEAEKKTALKKHICSEGKLELITNGIDISAVQKAHPKTRSELGIGEEDFVIGMIGRLNVQKAPDIFIQAARLIKKEIPNAYFIIVGSGEQEESTQEYAKQYNIPLLITGWTTEPYSYLKVFDLAMLLSRWEGFGLAIAEYMAAEKSIVATRIDAIPTLLDEGIDGLLVEKDNPQDVKDKVLHLYHHPQEAKKMREHALKRVKEKYDIKRVAQQHIRLFQEILNT